MEFKNKEIKEIAETLINIYNHARSAKIRFYIANTSEPFLDKRRLIQNEINSIINEEGIADDSGEKTIKNDNEHYLELMDSKTNVNFEYIELSIFDNIDIPIEDMLVIKKLIKAGD